MPDDNFTKLHPRTANISGQRFSNLVVVHFVDVISGNARWLCRCDCGNTIIAFMNNLTRKHTKSCGCRLTEHLQKRNTTHGEYYSPEYHIWYDIIRRCTQTQNHAYRHYGKRGITICDTWRVSFLSFLADMGARPTAHHTVERIDNNKGYYPGNCYWATMKEQSRNTRRNFLITFNDTTLCLADWAYKCNMLPSTLRARFHRGWSIEKALQTPVRYMSRIQLIPDTSPVTPTRDRRKRE